MAAELESKFRINSPLRCDGVGSLDCAEDTQSGTRLAIRWLPVDANGEAAVKALEEIPRHPVLPRIRQTGKLGSSAWVAMDFPEGRLLSTMVGVETIAPDHVARMGASVAGALATLHGQGMVHGELSADSVLMLGEGKAILWDAPLVLANRMTDRRGEERALALLIKVAPYLAPERARGLPASAHADVYGLGAVLCIAAGGELPPGGTTLAVVHQVANGQWTPELPRGMNPAVRTIVKRMIDPDPLSRPTAREVAEELTLLLERTPTDPEMRAVQLPPPLPARTASSSGVRAVEAKIAAAQEAERRASESGVRAAEAKFVAAQETERAASESGVRAAQAKFVAAQDTERRTSESGVRAAEAKIVAAQETERRASSSGVRAVETKIVAAHETERRASESGVRASDAKIVAAQETERRATDSGANVADATIATTHEEAPTASTSGDPARAADATHEEMPGLAAAIIGASPSTNAQVASADAAVPHAPVAPLLGAATAIDDDFDPDAFVSQVSGRNMRWIIGGAGFVGAVALVLVGVALLQGGNSQPAKTGTEQTNVAAAPSAQPAVEDVTDFVAPLVEATRPTSVRFRPAKASSTRVAAARPHPAARPATRAESPAAPADAKRTVRSSEQDFSFLPTGAPLPHSELKRPSF